MVSLTRTIFYNKRTGQGSITLPSETLKKIEQQLSLDKPLKKLSIKILSPKEVKDLKKSQV
jgi:hypothetical protein